MKWLEIVRFEVVYQLRRRTTWIVFGVLLFPLFGQTNGQALEALQRGIPFHSPLFLAMSGAGMSLILLLLMAVVTGDAATRDVQTRVEPLMHASSAGRNAYFGGRFIGAFLACAVFLLVVPLALIAAPFVLGNLTPELVGPFRPAALLQMFFLLVLPNAFVAAALMFALATLMRHPLGSWLGAFLVLVSALLTTNVVGRGMGLWDLATLLGPTGHTALGVMADTWSPVDLRNRLVGLGGGLAWNRLLWLALAFALLGFTRTRFRYGGAGDRVRAWWRGRATRSRPPEPDDSSRARGGPVVVPRVAGHFDAAGRVRQTLAIARDSLRETATGLKWVAPPLLAFQVLLAGEGLEFRGTPTVPTTGRVLEVLGAGPPPIVGAVFFFAVLFAGELIWRERDANLQALADAAPVPNWARFLGKAIGLGLAIAALQGVLVLAGMIVQVRLGWYDFDLALYFKVLLGLELVGIVAFGLFALSVHVLVNQKHVGHVVVLALLVAALNVASWLGIEHPLLLPFAAPGWRHSPISGFDPFLGPFLWYKLYWAAWTVLAAILAGLFWVRGVEPGLRERGRIARRRLSRPAAATVAGVAALVLLVGGFLFYQTEVLAESGSSAEDTERWAEYERRYARFDGAPQPRLTATTLAVEIHPDRREAEIRGVHVLSNRTTRPIDTIHVAVSPRVETSEIEFDRAARAARVDDDRGHRIHVLDQPLQPGESLRLSWEVRYAPRGIPAGGVESSVVGNGSFIETYDWIPLVGYQRGRELTDPVERMEHGLAPRPSVPSLDDVAARRDPTGKDRVDLEVTIGTAADQIAVAPGELRGTWTRDGRRYFRYETAAPVGIGYAIFSADYSVRRARWNGVTIEIVHHPAHGWNVDRMMRGLKASLAQYTERFGPYPYAVLRLVEHPGEGAAGLHAASATIWYEATFSLFDPDRDERRIDLPFAVVAHEVAHQFQPVPARVEGIALLSESFAWYAALGVIEEEYGVEHLRRFLGFMRQDELTPRPRADVPLVRAWDWFQAYRKGPFAMYALREYVGQDRVDLAWRRLIARHASGEPPYATSLDLVRELRAVTPDSLQYLLGDLLERNTFWELEARQATARRIAGGDWRVDIDVVARKVAVDTAGMETAMPMNDLVEIGVFAAAEAGESSGSPLHVEMHRIRTGPQTITVTVPERPAAAGIDPRHLLIDVEPDDNLVDVLDTNPVDSGRNR